MTESEVPPGQDCHGTKVLRSGFRLQALGYRLQAHGVEILGSNNKTQRMSEIEVKIKENTARITVDFSARGLKPEA